MTEYTLDTEFLLSVTDILKSTIPLFAALAASYLTYKFSKKDKIRDHLFTYKVKSYSSLAETILNSKRNFDALNHNLHADKSNDYIDNPEQISERLAKTISENALFISEQTKMDLKELETVFYRTAEYYIFNQINPIENPKEKLISFYTNASYKCLYLIEKLQSDLEIFRLNKRRRKFIFF